jgi:endonuclease YncB( thermonuclease family)
MCNRRSLGQFRTFAAFVAVAIFVSTYPALPADLTGRASIIDGDTSELHGTRIRLWGVDAPGYASFDHLTLDHHIGTGDTSSGQPCSEALAPHGAPSSRVYS